MRRQGSGQVGGRVDEELKSGRDGRSAQGKGHQRGEVSACTVAPDRHRAGSMPIVPRVLEDPPGRGERVVGAGGEPMLRRQAVVDRRDDDPGAAGERAADAVVRLDGPDDEAPSVELDEPRHERPARSRGCRDACGAAPRRRDRCDRTAVTSAMPRISSVLPTSSIPFRPPTTPRSWSSGCRAVAHEPEKGLPLQIRARSPRDERIGPTCADHTAEQASGACRETVE